MLDSGIRIGDTTAFCTHVLAIKKYCRNWKNAMLRLLRFQSGLFVVQITSCATTMHIGTVNVQSIRSAKVIDIKFHHSATRSQNSFWISFSRRLTCELYIHQIIRTTSLRTTLKPRHLWSQASNSFTQIKFFVLFRMKCRRHTVLIEMWGFKLLLLFIIIIYESQSYSIYGQKKIPMVI